MLGGGGGFGQGGAEGGTLVLVWGLRCSARTHVSQHE